MGEQNGYPVLLHARDWLDRYFAGKKPDILELKLNPSGGEFRKAVWDVLCQVSYGETATY